VFTWMCIGRHNVFTMKQRAHIVTVSDSAARDAAHDRSGPKLKELLESHGFEVISNTIIADGISSVREVLEEKSTDFIGLIVTTGGTGFGQRDHTPEATALVIERDAPGLAEAMRAINPLGRLSRGRCGVRGKSLIVNLPGSPKGAVEMIEAIIDVIPHALVLLAGEDPGH